MKNKATFISVLFFFTLTLFFFNKFFFKGLIPVASDIPTGMYYPWINNNYGYPVHVPVKNPILTDTVSQFWIWRNWGVENLKENKIPFWNPYSLAGYSMSPWFHTILFCPANFFYFLFEKTTAMCLIIISQLLIALIGTYFFIKEIAKSNLASVFGSISFSFSSFFIGWLTWGTISWTLAFLPIILFFIHKLIYEKNSFSLFIGLFVSTILSFLGGHPQTFLYVLIIIFLYIFSFIILNKNKIKKTVPIFIIFILCFLSTTFITIPSFQILKNSIRQTERYISSNNSGFIPFSKLVITSFAPDFFGNPSTNNYWGGDFNYQEKLVWFGTLAFILSIFYLISLTIQKKEKLSHINLFLVTTFILGILLSLKYPLGFFVYKFNLPLISTSSAGRSIILTIFSGSVLASLGIKKLKTKTKDNICSIKWTGLCFFSLIFILFSVLIALKTFFKDFLTSDFLININTGLRNMVIPCGVTVFSFFCIFLTQKFPKFNKQLIFILILIASTESLFFAWKYTPFTDPKLYFPNTKTIDFLQNKYQTESELFRIEREKSELMPPNMWQVYGFFSLSGYDPITPQNYANFLSKNSVIENPTRYVEYENKYINQMSDYGIKYFLALKRDRDNKIDPNGNSPKWLDNKKWTNVYQEGPVVVFQNNNFKPLYFLEKNNGNVLLVKRMNDYWEFKVNSTIKDKLILLENNDPNWQVSINNQPATIIPYKETFKSVEIQKGENIVIFSYRNFLFSKYLKFSIGSFVFSIILFFFFTKTKYKKYLE